MKILWLTSGANAGGLETLLLEIASDSRMGEHDLHIAYVLEGHGDLVASFEGAGVRVHALHGQHILDGRWVLNLWALLRRERFHVVHSHSPAPAVVARIFSLSLDFAHVTTEHAEAHLYARLSRAGLKATWRLDDSRMYVSKASQQSFGSVGGSVLYHGIQPLAEKRGGSELRSGLGFTRDDVVIMTIANLRPEKRLGDLLKAFTSAKGKASGVHLVIVGDGSERARLEDIVTALDISDSVRFLGRVENARTLLPAADIGVLTSESEGLPVFLMECLQAGIPVVATRVGGVGEAVLHGETGLLVDYGDITAFSRALSRLIRDIDMRAVFRERALSHSVKFSLHSCVNNHLVIYSHAAQRAVRNE